MYVIMTLFYNNFKICRKKNLINESIFASANGMLSEKGQLLEIHLLEKTARHQNLDCSTPFEQMSKK